MWNELLFALLRALIQIGTLDLTLADGTTRRFGDRSGPAIHVLLDDPALPARLVRAPDLALGEGYMRGTLRVGDDDLHGLMMLLARNAALGEVWWRKPATALRRALRPLSMLNPVPRSQRNVAHHYDLSPRLYETFLDRDWQYSCGYFRSPSDTLEQAQERKKAHIARKLLLRPGLRVLDIGCGWGGLALTLARDHGVHVTGITLSEEQRQTATRRAQEAGLTDRVTFPLIDYRQVTGTFDRIVSVGMFEHVGVPHYRTYFRKIGQLLAPDGVALIHTIGRAAPPGYTSAFILKYIFPGGYVPALSETMRAVERENLWTSDVEVWRMHYADTLRHWHDRFMANADKVRDLYDEAFVRMWRFYLVASEAAFREGPQCVFQLQLAHRADTVPVTRDYLYDSARPTGDALATRHAAAAE